MLSSCNVLFFHILFSSVYGWLVVFRYAQHQRQHTEVSCRLLTSLIECLPAVVAARSAGAVQWYFTLLGHLSQFDGALVAAECIKLLLPLAKAFGAQCTGAHATLCTRFALL